MSKDRDKQAMELCNKFVNLLNITDKQKFNLIDKIGCLWHLGEEYERLNKNDRV
jgi:hypothetical protein